LLRVHRAKSLFSVQQGPASAHRTPRAHTARRTHEMKLNRLAIPALALALGTTGFVMAEAHSSPQGPPPPGYGYGQDQGGWDAPPQEFRDIQRQGFHDGIE